MDENKNYYLVLATKVRIGIGLACCCLCWWRLRSRLQKIRNEDYYFDREGYRVYNIYEYVLVSLGPQLCLLGLGAGRIEDGVDEFLYCHTETLKD